MNWTELDALADELRDRLARGALLRLPWIPSDFTHTLTTERMARIVLADVDHLHSLDGMPATGARSLDRRREDVAANVRRLLDPANFNDSVMSVIPAKLTNVVPSGARCSHCESPNRDLYAAPTMMGKSDDQWCQFCFMRLVQRSPHLRERMC